MRKLETNDFKVLLFMLKEKYKELELNLGSDIIFVDFYDVFVEKLTEYRTRKDDVVDISIAGSITDYEQLVSAKNKAGILDSSSSCEEEKRSDSKISSSNMTKIEDSTREKESTYENEKGNSTGRDGVIYDEESHCVSNDPYNRFLTQNVLEEDTTYFNEITAFLKLVISQYLKTHKEEYQPYLEQDVETYCKTRVDSFYVETGEIEMGVLSKIFGVKVKVIYADRMDCEPCFGDGERTFNILYTGDHFEPLFED